MFSKFYRNCQIPLGNCDEKSKKSPEYRTLARYRFNCQILYQIGGENLGKNLFLSQYHINYSMEWRDVKKEGETQDLTTCNMLRREFFLEQLSNLGYK